MDERLDYAKASAQRHRASAPSFRSQPGAYASSRQPLAAAAG